MTPLPCPFCGGEPLLEEVTKTVEPYFCLGCNDASCAGHRVYDAWGIAYRDESIARWNRRAESPKYVGDTARLDYLAKTLHVDATGDDPIMGMFIPGTEDQCHQAWSLREYIDYSMKLVAERDARDISNSISKEQP